MSWRRTAVAVAIVLAAAVAAPPVSAAAPAADPPPTITVTPTTGLVDGQLVSVDGAGWPPGDTFHHMGILVCPADETRCDRLASGFEAEADGTFHRQVRVRTTFRSDDGTVTDCRAVACHLFVNESITQPRLVEPLSFDPGAPLLADPVLTVTPADDLIEDQPVAVHGTGFFADEPLLLTLCTPGLDPHSCGGWPVEADDAGVLDTTAHVRTFQLQWHGGYDCRTTPFCSVYVLDPVDRVVRASAPLHLRPEGDETVTVAPSAGLPAEATVTVHATGLNEPYEAWVAQCWDDPQHGSPWPSCERGRATFTVGPDRELTTTYRVQRHVRIVSAYDGTTRSIDCAVDPNCTLTVGGDAIDALMHNGMGDRGAWIDTPLSFRGDATPATPADPIAASPAFAG